jgi:hypothetical protein
VFRKSSISTVDFRPNRVSRLSGAGFDTRRFISFGHRFHADESMPDLPSYCIRGLSSRFRFILIGMDSPATTRAYVAWLLCAVLLCLAVHSRHCDRCDGPDFLGPPSPQTLVHQQQPDVPDGCNGACWCCVFHGVANTAIVIDLVNQVSSRVWPPQPSDVQAPRSSLFRPPRIPVSS